MMATAACGKPELRRLSPGDLLEIVRGGQRADPSTGIGKGAEPSVEAGIGLSGLEQRAGNVQRNVSVTAPREVKPVTFGGLDLYDPEDED